MATRAAADTRTPWLPEHFRRFLQRRSIELGGLALLACAGLLAAALASYTSSDPSMNTAGDGTVRNLIGRPGAYAADFILQAVGAAGIGAAAMLAAWGWALLSHRGIRRMWLRGLLAVFALALASAGLGALPAPGAWPIAAGLGGVVGELLAIKAVALSGGLGADAVAAIALGLALAVFVGALGLTWREWRAIFWGAGRLGRAILFGTISAFRWLRRLTSPRFASEEIPVTLKRERTGPAHKEPSLYEDKSTPAAKRRERTLVETKSKPGKPSPRAAKEAQSTLDLDPSDEYSLPALDLLSARDAASITAKLSEDALEQNAEMLLSVLEDFSVQGDIERVRPGPVVTLYEFVPQAGTRTSRVIGLSDDIARSMSALSVRAATIPGRNVIGIELPNPERETVLLRELLSSSAYESTAATLTLALGKDISGAPVIADLGRMPHLLIAGTTGSGKSVGINSMILSLLYRLPPDQCKMILIDPKMLELSVYDDIPHLLTPVVTDPAKAVVALKWTVREMENRYQAMSKLGVRNITGYNKRLAEARASGEQLTRRVQTGIDSETGAPIHEEIELDLTHLPFIVVVVDEMADLMLVAGKDIEGAVQRLAQMARAAGIHLIMATQRPSVDVITGTIKANFPTRISFQVTSKIDSRTILGEAGAEQLLGQGDMLYLEGAGRLTRVHGPFVSDEEVEQVTDFLRAQARPSYIAEVTEEPDSTSPDLGDAAADDPLYDQAVALVARERKASTSFIQRHLQIGYNRAARIIERMETQGVVGQANHVGKREVLVGDHSGID